MRSSEDSSRYVVISADTHAGADLLEYKAYLDSSWHDTFDEWSKDFADPWATFGKDDGAASAGTEDEALSSQHMGFQSSSTR